VESMTGFGKGIFQGEGFTLTVYANSINHRYLDVHLKLPRRYQLLEEKVRKTVAEYIGRGRVDIWVKFSGISPVSREVLLDIELAKRLKKGLEEMREALGFEEPLSLSDFVRFRDYLYLEEPEEDLSALWEELEPALRSALEELKTARLREGKLLEEHIEFYLKELEGVSKEIEALREKVKEKHILRFKDRVSSLLKEFGSQVDEVRIYQEIALLLDRFDFAEEIDRLKSHIVHFKEISKEPACGKRLDFICQEMFREVNTLSNKAQDPEVSKHAVKAKDLIEKLREQVQNIV